MPSVLKLPSGINVSTFAAPPSKFDPTQATDADLIKYGFPSRAQASAAPAFLKRFESALADVKAGRLRMIQPTFEHHPVIFHGPRRPSEEGVKAGTESSSNWSGSVQHAPAGQAFSWVIGDFTVPSVYPAGGATSGNTQYCAVWVGIDGDGSGDVCQAGIQAQVTPEGTVQSYYPWFEWYPEAEIGISNHPVGPGDEISVLICTSGAGATSASLYFTNMSRGTSTSFAFTAPGTTKLIGNCAEWITERPGVNGALATLPNYGSETFFDAYAVTSSTTFYAGGPGANNTNMVNGSTALSDGSLVASEVVQTIFVS